MIKTLRPYQQDTLDLLKSRLRKTTNPLLVNASVGSGKSLILSELLLIMERTNYHALCLTMNSTLIKQNADTYSLQGGNPGIYCAGLKEKCLDKLVIFGSPHSVGLAIKKNEPFSKIKFNLIIVDECHNIDHNNPDSMYMRILNWYGYQAQLDNYSFRIVGLTGTPYRGKGISIVGDNEYFKEEVCSISTSWLIEHNYLTKPYFGRHYVDSIDFSNCHADRMGKFKHKDIELALEKNNRLTHDIMQELQKIECKGIFIFASTRQHCVECAASLPDGQWAIVTGETPHEERKDIIQNARDGDLKYLISVGCLNVGVDIPLFDVCAWLRPTESLVLYTQGIGRVLRLHPGKERAIVLDYAGNLERHGDIDDPIINQALQSTAENEKDYCIPCYTCGTNNTIHARRCIGIVDSTNSRCDHYFEFKECHNCQLPNDITSRYCRGCETELIDPNAKLRRSKPETYTLTVIEASYSVAPMGNTSYPVINVAYDCRPHRVFESHLTNTDKSKHILYANFIKKHVPHPSVWYPRLNNLHFMRKMLLEEKLITPSKLICTKNNEGYYRIVKKIFN